MSHYIHHIPGRLRVRSNSFRCRTAAAQSAHDQLMAMAGVSHVRLNPRAGSITVQYDPDLVNRSQLLAVLEDAGCAGVMARGADTSSEVGQLFGKALVGAIVNKAVERSAVRLVSVLL